MATSFYEEQNEHLALIRDTLSQQRRESDAPLSKEKVEAVVRSIIYGDRPEIAESSQQKLQEMYTQAMEGHELELPSKNELVEITIPVKNKDMMQLLKQVTDFCVARGIDAQLSSPIKQGEIRLALGQQDATKLATHLEVITPENMRVVGKNTGAYNNLIEQGSEIASSLPGVSREQEESQKTALVTDYVKSTMQKGRQQAEKPSVQGFLTYLKTKNADITVDDKVDKQISVALENRVKENEQEFTDLYRDANRKMVLSILHGGAKEGVSATDYHWALDQIVEVQYKFTSDGKFSVRGKLRGDNAFCDIAKNIDLKHVNNLGDISVTDLREASREKHFASGGARNYDKSGKIVDSINNKEGVLLGYVQNRLGFSPDIKEQKGITRTNKNSKGSRYGEYIPHNPDQIMVMRSILKMLRMNLGTEKTDSVQQQGGMER